MIFFEILFAILGLLCAGLLLFPWKITCMFTYEQSEFKDYNIRFWKWSLLQKQFAEISPDNTTNNQILPQVIPHSNSTTTNNYSTPKTQQPNVFSKSHVYSEPKVIAPETPIKEKKTLWSHLSNRIWGTISQMSLWKGWLIWFLHLLKPSWSLFGLSIQNLEIHLGSKDPLTTTKFTSTWLACSPCLGDRFKNIAFIPHWQPKEYHKFEGKIIFQHRLGSWLPWFYKAVISYPWQHTWKAWKKTSSSEFAGCLNKFELIVYNWFMEDN